MQLWSPIVTTSVSCSNLECLSPTGAGHIVPGTTVTEVEEAQSNVYLVGKGNHEKSRKYSYANNYSEILRKLQHVLRKDHTRIANRTSR